MRNCKKVEARERLIKTKQNKNKTDGSLDMTGGLLVMVAITEAHSMFFFHNFWFPERSQVIRDYNAGAKH